MHIIGLGVRYFVVSKACASLALEYNKNGACGVQ